MQTSEIGTRPFDHIKRHNSRLKNSPCISSKHFLTTPTLRSIMSSNYSLHSIPVYWLVALYPHAYAVRFPSSLSSPSVIPPSLLLPHPLTTPQQGLFKSATNGQRSNANPRGTSTLSHYRKICPKEVFEKAERAEACHMNSMENAPFFVGAVLAGNFAGLSSGKRASNYL
jgi:hypothetical protein